jgi:hypothetical protein
MHRRALILASAASFLLPQALPNAHAGSAPPQATPLSDNPYISYSNPKDWVVKMHVRIEPTGAIAGSGNTAFPGWKYTNFAIAMPYTVKTGTSWITEPGPQQVVDSDQFVTAGLLLNGQVVDMPEIPTRTVPRTGASYAYLQVPGTVAFEVATGFLEARVTSVETRFNEQAAWNLPWAEYPPAVSAWLELDPNFDIVKPGEEDLVQPLLDKWTGGNDPKKIPPVQLAKYLTACVLEHARTTGNNREAAARSQSFRAPGGRNGVASVSYGTRGFNVQNASETARTAQGSEHDLVKLLAAVLRRAGVPTRIVIGVDNDEAGDDEVRSWLEFAIIAPNVKDPIWIPVDVWELENDSRSTRNWQRPWKHFGTTETLRDIAPIAHYFQPPADLVVYGLPALFGIRADGEVPAHSYQSVNFEVNGAAKRAPSPRRR